jgi:hypothetical protein
MTRPDSPLKLALAAFVGAAALCLGCWLPTLIAVALGVTQR